jgi:hypothetical protein
MAIIRTMPLTIDMLGQTIDAFFKNTVPARNPPGKFYVINGDYIGKNTPAGTLVLFHLHGRIVVHARLQHDWWQQNDDRIRHPKAKRFYILDVATITVLNNPLRLSDLPQAWQLKWPRGQFDQRSRTLDDTDEKNFLRSAIGTHPVVG